MKKKSGLNIEKFIGLAAGLNLIISILALIGAVTAFLFREYLAASLNLIAAALGSGLFLRAVLSP